MQTASRCSFLGHLVQRQIGAAACGIAQDHPTRGHRLALDVAERGHPERRHAIEIVTHDHDRSDFHGGHSMNIHRWPSKSSTRYLAPGPPSSISDNIVAPSAFARSKCAATSETWTSTPSMM